MVPPEWLIDLQPWLPFINPAASVAAVLVSIAALANSVKARKATEPTIRIWFSQDLIGQGDDLHVYMDIELNNLTSTPVEITALEFSGWSSNTDSRIRFDNPDAATLVDGTAPPLVLEGGRSLSFRYEIKELDLFGNSRQGMRDSATLRLLRSQGKPIPPDFMLARDQRDPKVIARHTERGWLTVLLGNGREVVGERTNATITSFAMSTRLWRKDTRTVEKRHKESIRLRDAKDRAMRNGADREPQPKNPKDIPSERDS